MINAAWLMIMNDDVSTTSQHQAYLLAFLLNGVSVCTLFVCTYLKINKNIVKIEYEIQNSCLLICILYYFGNHAHRRCASDWLDTASQDQSRIPSTQTDFFFLFRMVKMIIFVTKIITKCIKCREWYNNFNLRCVSKE